MLRRWASSLALALVASSPVPAVAATPHARDAGSLATGVRVAATQGSSPQLLLAAKRTRIVAGRRAPLTGRIQPRVRGVKVEVQRWTGAKWKRSATTRTGRAGRFMVKAPTPSRPGRTWFRAVSRGKPRTLSGHVRIRLLPKPDPAPDPVAVPDAPPSLPPVPPPAAVQPPAPPAPPPPITPIDPRAVAATATATCGLDVAGKIWCWGSRGETADPAPAPVPESGEFISLAASAGTVCGLDTLGAARCWGDPAVTGRAAGVAADVPGDHRFTTLAGGAGASAGLCALDTDGAAWCWGWGPAKSLGEGNSAWQTPRRVAPGHSGLTGITFGESHGCVLDRDGLAWCWGRNDSGQLGTGNADLGPYSYDLLPVSGARKYTTIAASGGHTCAIAAADARLWCWGANEAGQLGSEIKRNSGCAGPSGITTWFCQTSPTAVRSQSSHSDITTGLEHTCATDSAGQMSCWGNNDSAQLGSGGISPPVSEPQPVSGGFTVRQAAAGHHHTCAVAVDSRMWCWGAGDAGQLGVGVWLDTTEHPVALPGELRFLQPR